MIRCILVPLDGSAFGEHALPTAISMARRSGASLHLAHVHQTAVPLMPAGITIDDPFDLNLFQGESSYLIDVARRIREKAPLALHTVLLEGNVAGGLKAYADRHAVDLVVMATHARGAFARFWLGSVADDLAHELTQPIVLVPQCAETPDLSQEPPMRSIVVPLDGSALAEKIVAPAVELCQLYGAELHLVRVNRPAPLPRDLPERCGSLEEILEQMARQGDRDLDEARTYLAAVASRLRNKGLAVRTNAVVGRRPVAGILDQAQADHADLIAMETHGRRGLARLFMGSVADDVIRSGGIPVLLHHVAG